MNMPRMPEVIDKLWPVLAGNNRSMSVVSPEPGTPEGQIVIQPEYDTLRFHWYCDPARDFLTARQIEWSKGDSGWKFTQESRARRFQRLSGNQWYVAAWGCNARVKITSVTKTGGFATSEGDWTSYKRLEITPLAIEQFRHGSSTANDCSRRPGPPKGRSCWIDWSLSHSLRAAGGDNLLIVSRATLTVASVARPTLNHEVGSPLEMRQGVG